MITKSKKKFNLKCEFCAWSTTSSLENKELAKYRFQEHRLKNHSEIEYDREKIKKKKYYQTKQPRTFRCEVCNKKITVSGGTPTRKTCNTWQQSTSHLSCWGIRHWFLYYTSDVRGLYLIWKRTSKCQICGLKFKSARDKCIDHDPKTRKVRGIICQRCNKGLGAFADTIHLLLRAVQYLNYPDVKIEKLSKGKYNPRKRTGLGWSRNKIK